MSQTRRSSYGGLAAETPWSLGIVAWAGQRRQPSPARQRPRHRATFSAVHDAGLSDLNLIHFRRFANPRQLMAWLGLVPREHSSGASTNPGAITKAGNGRARRLLIESPWAYP